MPLPLGITREHILLALADLEAGAKHTFGAGTKYKLMHNGKGYPPKAVLGIAAKHLTGIALGPYDFSSGRTSGQAVEILEKLGFEIQEISNTPWTDADIDILIADYFSMLAMELQGLEYKKSAHISALQDSTLARSDMSIKFMYQRISAVLRDHWHPHIRGYRPVDSYPERLKGRVLNYVAQHDIATSILPAKTARPFRTPIHSEIFCPPPKPSIASTPSQSSWRSITARTANYAERESNNRQLGRSGEDFVLSLEQSRLQLAGRDDLAAMVEHVSVTRGDGLGFDILSYSESDGAELLIEVKTTVGEKSLPFYLTDSELSRSVCEPKCYRLYRVYDFAKSPKIYVLSGSLAAACRLRPVHFIAGVA